MKNKILEDYKKTWNILITAKNFKTTRAVIIKYLWDFRIVKRTTNGWSYKMIKSDKITAELLQKRNEKRPKSYREIRREERQKEIDFENEKRERRIKNYWPQYW